VRPASEAERARLNETFAELCRISSPFGSERAIADDVTARLRAMGLQVEEDDAAGPAQAGAGNLLARIPGRSERSILLCAHLDTVEQSAPIEPVLVDGGWENEHEGILGADNKAAVAVFLEVARRATVESSPVGIELLFTVAEENGLLGAAHFDASRLRSEFGYVLDHATPIGEVVTASPTYYRVGAEFHGRAAHAGIRPEEGRSAILAAALAIAAMPAGRIDAETTANVGSVTGGVGSTNVVAERAKLLAEARSIDPEKAETTVSRMIDAINDGAAAAECDVDITTRRLFAGYRQKPSSPAVVAAEAALRACGYAPRRIATGGGSDANALEVAGFPCVNLANGTERNHEPTERVSVAALEGMLDVVLALLDEAAALPAAEPPPTAA
jgi:tripeptide aminopeptidase